MEELSNSKTNAYAAIENPTTEDANNFIESLCTESALLARRLMKRPPKLGNKSKDGWSPHMMVLKSQLKSLVEVLRRKTGTINRPKWTSPREHVLGMEYWLSRWMDTANNLRWQNDDAKQQALQSTGKGPAYWRRRPHADPNEIAVEIRAVLSKLHGQRRKELMSSINDNCKRRELRRVDKQMGLLIASMTNKFSPTMDMDEI
jgi:hypothetical protein